MSDFWNALFGLQSDPNVETTQADGIQIKDIRGDRPKFEREYCGTLPERGIRITLKMRHSYAGGDRYRFGELTQPDGKWITFDPDRVAEKIIDPVLVPLVEDFCRRARALDNAFIASNPSEFVDEGGRRWRRVDA